MTIKIDRRDFLTTSGATAGLAAIMPWRASAASGPLYVTSLKVDSIDRPLGLESPRPRLSWKLESSERNVRQNAYRLWVSSSKAALAQGRGDLWDSGKVAARSSIGIRYQGRELVSRQRCWWRVQVWDERSVAAESEASYWEMGLLSPQDWQAQWLAVEDTVMRADRESGLHWIWGSTQKDELARKFRLSVRLPARACSGVLYVGGQDHLASVWVDGDPMPIDVPAQYAVGPEPLSEISLGALAQGDHVIAVAVETKVASSQPPPGMTAFVRIELENGTTLRIPAGPQWRTSLAQEPDWFKIQYDDRTWEIAGASLATSREPWPPSPALHLRKEFVVAKPIAHARLYATALGAYEARINGERVGDALLAPESTLFAKRALYRVYDVTEMLHEGANVLGFTVGDGWYGSEFFLHGRYAFGPPPRRLLGQLELTFSDGSRHCIATNPEWRITQSPIRRAELYNGEEYDARLESPGWDKAGFDEASWEPAHPAQSPPCKLTAQVSPPIRATQILKPHTIGESAPGVYVVDFGQNFSGWCRLRAQGPAGTRITLRFAERLLPSGEIDRSNLRSAKQTDTFILRGASSEEVFEPHFTHHGFRYVQISGLLVAPTKASIEGIVIHSDLPITGTLSIDNALIQKIWRNTLWTQRSNLVGIPTDCPQRDERYGYLADSAIFWDAAAFNMDVAAFTRRFMQTAADSQGGDGAYPPSAPWPVPSPAIPGWADGAIILPWTTWRRYGDVAVIEANWAGMRRYLQLIQENNPDYLWRDKRVDLGDHLAVDARDFTDPTTPYDLIATAYWSHSVDLLAQMGAALGKHDEAGSLRKLHDRIREAFVVAFVKADGRVGNESQTSYVLALKFGLMPSALRTAAAERLAANIRRRGGSLSTGYLGTQFLLDVLADEGHVDVAYDLLLRTEYPSWGHMITQGATTIWEAWDGKTWSGAPGEKMPNSDNHFALGAICGFLFRRIAGIDAASPGFETIVIRPALDPRVKKGGGTYDAAMGRISTEWTQSPGGGFTLDVSIPANGGAHIHLPARREYRIKESGRRISPQSDVQIVSRLDREAVIAVGSGSYRFEVVASV